MNVLEDGRVTRFNYQRFKAIELACNYFSILGVILSVYQVKTLNYRKKHRIQ